LRVSAFRVFREDGDVMEKARSMEKGVVQKGNDYWIDYRFNGKRIRTKIGPSRKLAETIMRKKRVEIAEGKHLDVSKASKVKFKDLAHVYMENHAKPNKRSWHSCDFKYLKNLTPVFGERPLSAITPLMIERYKGERRERDGVSVATVNRELSLLRCMFNKAIDWEMADSNPLRKVEFYKENNCRLRYLELEEMRRLLEACSSPLRSIVTLALNTGMRKSEIQFLKWEDVNFTRGFIELRQTKNGEKRMIPMNKAIYDALAAVNRHRTSPYIFAGEDGNPYNFRKSFETASKKSGIISLRFCDLRYFLLGL